MTESFYALSLLQQSHDKYSLFSTISISDANDSKAETRLKWNQIIAHSLITKLEQAALVLELCNKFSIEQRFVRAIHVSEVICHSYEAGSTFLRTVTV